MKLQDRVKKNKKQNAKLANAGNAEEGTGSALPIEQSTLVASSDAAPVAVVVPQDKTSSANKNEWVPCSSQWVSQVSAIHFCASAEADCTSAYLHLASADRMSFIGMLAIRVRSGAIDISSAIFHPSDDFHYVYACASHGALLITPRSSDRESLLTADEKKMLKKFSLSSSSCVVEIMSYGSLPASVRLHLSTLAQLEPSVFDLQSPTDLQYSSPDLKQLSRVCSPAGCILGSLWPESLIGHVVRDDVLPHVFQPVTTPVPDHVASRLSHRLSKTVATTMITGRKGAGKSSVVRLYVNTLLTRHKRVAVLDCDPGQPLAGPPGLVSLFVVDSDCPLASSVPVLCETAFRSSTKVSLFLGSASPDNGPTEYLQALQRLVAAYYERCASHAIPLVINASGWIRGMGADVLGEMVQLMLPDAIVHLAEETVPTLPFQMQELLSYTVGVFSGLPLSAVSQPTSRTTASLSGTRVVYISAFSSIAPKKTNNLPKSLSIDAGRQRTVLLASHFASLSSSMTRSSEMSIADILSSAKPYRISLDALSIRGIGTLAEGTFVGICDSADHCIGLGLVRAFDRERRIVFMLSSLDPQQMQRGVVVQLASDLHIPAQFYTTSVLSVDAQSFMCAHTISGTGTGAGQLKTDLPVLGRKRMQPEFD